MEGYERKCDLSGESMKAREKEIREGEKDEGKKGDILERVRVREKKESKKECFYITIMLVLLKVLMADISLNNATASVM
eukprot:1370016-Amorphochlora_amoeboformis.AAC.1